MPIRKSRGTTMNFFNAFFQNKSNCVLTKKDIRLVMLSKEVYLPRLERKSFGGLKYQNQLSGERFGVWRNDVDRIFYYVVRGTVDKKDFNNDLKLFKNDEIPFFKSQESIFNSIKGISKGIGYEVILSGHSLGGTTAMYLGLKNPEVKGVVFNAFIPTRSDFFIELSKNNNIKKYTIKGDTLSNKLLLILERKNVCSMVLVGNHTPLYRHSISTFLTKNWK